MLQLKSQTKELFDKAGLGEFTIGRNSLNNLAIVGPCGKAIVEVTNFPVGTKLSKDERNITINEYLIPTLKAHSAIILDMIKFKGEVIKAEDDVLDAVKAIHEKEEIGLEHGFSNYGSKKKFYVKAKESLKDTKDQIEVYVDESDQDMIKIISASTKEIKALTKRADELLKICNEIYALKAIHSKADGEFVKAEASMREECSL